MPIMRLRRMVYSLGYRPRPGTLLYSPSLALLYAACDNPITRPTADEA